MAQVDDSSLSATRRLLKTSLENSRAIATALDKTGPRLAEIKQRLPALEAAVGPGSSKIGASVAIRQHVDLAVGPAAAVLKVMSSIRELEKSLLSDLHDPEPCLDALSSYLESIKRFEQALKFLADNCSLAIQWLDSIVEFTKDTSFSNDRYIFNVKKSLRILQELKAAKEHARSNGGLLSAAFDRLETSFKQLLLEADGDFSLPISTIKKLKAIIERLTANDRLNKCTSIFVEARSLKAGTSLQALDLDYLEKSLADIDDFQDTERCIVQWGKHLELVVKNLLDLEYRLCVEIFTNGGPGVWTDCFSKIAAKSGFLSFLQFGMNIAESKKDPMKLLKLLYLFKVLNDLRGDFNKLFGGEACSEIQAMIRELIKKLVSNASEIFWELPAQVELQRKSCPPEDGSIPRLASFVTDYCDQLLGDNYRPILTKVLEIHQSWRHEKYGIENGIVTNQIYGIVKEIALNLDAWSKAYDNPLLSYFFMMNNHCHFCNLEGTNLGNIMGGSWLTAHRQYKDYYAALYLRESWGKLLAFLSQENPISSSPSRGKGAISDSLKKRLKAFNDAFDDIYKKQSNWVISDEDLRQKICHIIMQNLVPAYKSYLQNYKFVVERERDAAAKYVKYTVQSVENMVNALFRPKLLKYSSLKGSRFVGEIQNVVTSTQPCLTLTAI